MIHYTKTTCCGCGGCAAICPKGAITMTPDGDGFLYPLIDERKCVQCGLCEQVCAYRNHTTPVSEKEVYAAASGDTNVRESASGGLFASIAQAVLSDGGAVYGCAMEYESGQLFPRHICVTEPSELIRLKGSKYVQSDLGNTYPEIRRRLESGQTVLFSGTPCQAAGLRGFLRKEYENLFILDIICHGVPSTQMFQDYLRFEEQKRKKKIVAFKFRDKSEGWKLHGKMTVEDDQGQRTEAFFEPEESSYYQMFLNSYTYRENCYTCPYACDHRPGDITIGDYWCIDLVHPEMLVQNGGVFDEQKGVSCLIINNSQGKKLMSAYGAGIEKRKSTFEEAARYNGQLTHASVRKPEREIVLQKYALGYAKADQWYRRKRIPIKVKRTIRGLIPRKVKEILKKMLKR